MPARSPEADLARLEEEERRLQRRLDAFTAKVEARLVENRTQAKAIRAYLELRPLYESVAAPPSPPSPVPAKPAPAPRALSPDSPFYGKSMAEAGAVLIDLTGHPLTEDEIIDGLRDAGVPMVSVNPIVNFRMAARRRMDILAYRDGRWERVISEGAEPKPPSTGCIPNRSRELHMAKTLEGLANARARGVVGGRRPTVPPDTREKAERMLAPVTEGGEGLTIRAAAERLGVSTAWFYKNLPSFKARSRTRPVNGHDQSDGEVG